MADDVEKTEEKESVLLSAYVAAVRRKAQQIEPGEAGECDKCGEPMPRLINGICCRCRDLHGLS